MHSTAAETSRRTPSRSIHGVVTFDVAQAVQNGACSWPPKCSRNEGTRTQEALPESANVKSLLPNGALAGPLEVAVCRLLGDLTVTAHSSPR